MHELILRCLDPDPAKRPSALQCAEVLRDAPAQAPVPEVHGQHGDGASPPHLSPEVENCNSRASVLLH